MFEFQVYIFLLRKFIYLKKISCICSRQYFPQVTATIFPFYILFQELTSPLSRGNAQSPARESLTRGRIKLLAF